MELPKMYDKINKAIRCVSSLMYEKIVSESKNNIEGGRFLWN